MTIAYRPADLRPITANTELHFIVDSWVSSYQFAHAAGMIAVEDWFDVMIPQVDKLLRRPNVQTIVAYETDDPDRIADLYGYIAFDATAKPPIVFYVFVKEYYRGNKLARGLFQAAGIDLKRPFVYACTTGIVSKIAYARKIPLAKWDPLVARFGTHDNRPRRAR
jgi:hypothetical protein